jgi:hypothetical protein
MICVLRRGRQRRGRRALFTILLRRLRSPRLRSRRRAESCWSTWRRTGAVIRPARPRMGVIFSAADRRIPGDRIADGAMRSLRASAMRRLPPFRLRFARFWLKRADELADDLRLRSSRRGAAPNVDSDPCGSRRMAARGPSLMAGATITVTPQIVSRLRFAQGRSAMRAHARGQVAGTCRACGEPVEARRSTRRYCAAACRQRAYRAGRRPILARVAHQRRIREAEAARDPRRQMASLGQFLAGR